MIKAIEWTKNKLFLIDQTKLPGKLSRFECKTAQQVADAIAGMKVRGAPAIGVAAAFGVYLGVRRPPLAKTFEQLESQVAKLCALLGKTRPTAVNLFWALDRMKRCTVNNRDHKLATLRDILLREALNIYREDEKVTKAIAAQGAELMRDGDTIMTHCNAGALATAGVGTALGVVVEASRKHKGIKALVGETRPRLQGARLTAWELKQAHVPFHLITDNMAAYFMKKGDINVVIVGADRIAMNGDVANKIGTYGLAMLAYHHNIPFYVAAPVSTFDRSLASGDSIPIEERSPLEVTHVNERPISIAGVKALNPAFDVTPHRFISAIITELGVVRAPFDQNLKNLFANLV
ncbi:MAG: S-methyl-5-thioribose-1-phosphate isomerase [Candidatus Firestonebacteria bacterium]|nr:S-methyl-5-thioribose-1-phosphate isomerase [Candidatus Firestonebacteria bacterium]